MNKIEEFNNLLKEIIKTGTCNDKNINYRSIKTALKDNEKDSNVIESKKVFAEYLYRLFENKEVTDALNSDNNYPYGKILNIYKNNPFNKYPKVNEFFQFTIYIPEGSHLENNVNWFIEDCGLPHSNNLDLIRDFNFKNRNLSYKEEYGTYEQEIERYNKMLNGDFNNHDFDVFLNNIYANEFAFSKFYTGDNIQDYLNKKLGNIGELYLYNTLVKEKDTVFVARDLGNGFGYDIYTTAFMDGKKKELLFEVKTTTDMNNDTFALSENEYKVLCESLNCPNTEYIVARAHFGIKQDINNLHNKVINVIDENNIKYNYYVAKDENTFKNLNNDEEYKLMGKINDKDGVKIIFRKYQKTLKR